MKTILIVIAALIVAALAIIFLWTTKPPAIVPRAVVENNFLVNPNNPVIPGTTGSTSTGTTGSNTSTAAKTPTAIDAAHATFTFTGYGPGKEETGTFKTVNHNLTVKDGKVTGGLVVIDTKSVSTGKNLLDKHLCAEDFFDCAKYPAITFTISSISNASVSGVVNFRGVAKNVTFPITFANNTYTADFVIDTTAFNFKYTAVNKEVRIQFRVPLK